ncbi:MAG: histidinol-phosphatase HisJ family protein [Bacillota bacterium]|jgi:histidinol-phosphatase (PHP family)|nr:histidinol-phosphatase HisJ family protein [Bacillota bacterium]NLM08950.1 histidinol-phosphatase HisJ family protein [Clostridiales Family XIII bacterium]
MEYLRTDYHVHPDYSIDGTPVKIREYCEKALELDIKELCFTTHVELDPARREIDNFVYLNGEKASVYNYVWLDNYFEEIARAQDEFEQAGLKVKAGIEIGYNPGCEKHVEYIVNNYPFDFVMGAIHCLDHIAISSMKESLRFFKNKSLGELRNEYFAMLMEMVKTGLFDCVAHVDLYIRYGIRVYGSDIFTVHRGAAEPVFEEMARRGMGLEINTSSRHRGLEEFHPTGEILDLAVKSGIEVYTVGSDAHSLDILGCYIDEALEILKERNLRNHVFTRRKATPF